MSPYDAGLMRKPRPGKPQRELAQGKRVMNALVWLIAAILNLLLYAIIISAIASWLVAFNVINPYNNFVRTILHTLNRIVEPLCRPVRRVLPDLGGVDLSPLVVGLGIMFLLRLLRDFFPGAFM